VTYQLLVCDDDDDEDVNVLEDNKNNIKKNTKTLIDAFM
jgi:hypothetical protein